MSSSKKPDQAFLDHKAFQQRVRARQARTGEKYQLAYRRQQAIEAGESVDTTIEDDTSIDARKLAEAIGAQSVIEVGESVDATIEDDTSIDASMFDEAIGAQPVPIDELRRYSTSNELIASMKLAGTIKGTAPEMLKSYKLPEPIRDAVKTIAEMVTAVQSYKLPPSAVKMIGEIASVAEKVQSYKLPPSAVKMIGEIASAMETVQSYKLPPSAVKMIGEIASAAEKAQSYKLPPSTMKVIGEIASAAEKMEPYWPSVSSTLAEHARVADMQASAARRQMAVAQSSDAYFVPPVEVAPLVNDRIEQIEERLARLEQRDDQTDDGDNEGETMPAPQQRKREMN